MFEHQHYVPVLRIKPAELRALRASDPVLRSRVTPILECPPGVLRGCDTLVKLERRFDRIVSHISGWSGRSVFIDFSMVGSSKPQALETMVARAARAGIRPILVLSLKGGADSMVPGICLRISPEELRLTDVGEKIDARLKLYAASPAVTDLVIDRVHVDSGSRTYEEFAGGIPSVLSWRTLTVLAGSFPEDLSHLEPRATHRLRRFEWKQWKALASWSGRRPAFGDSYFFESQSQYQTSAPASGTRLKKST